MGKSAVVIGGSLGGLFAAHALRTTGWDVSVFERSNSELSGRGAGIVTHPELFETMARVGLDPDAKVGVPVSRRVCFNTDGTVAHKLHYPQIVASWDQLYRLLRGSLPDEYYHLGAGLSDLRRSNDQITARISDRDVLADLVVGADGIRSTVRNLLAPDINPIYAGYIAWRGLVDEADLSPETCSDLMDSFAFSLPPGEQMLGYPVPGPMGADQVGHRRFNFVWYRPAPAAVLKNLLTDQTGKVWHDGIPPHAIRADIIGEMRKEAKRLLSPQFQEVVGKTTQPFLQPIFDVSGKRLWFDGVALIGDAAFVARPHVGMGVTKAASDALALAEYAETGDFDRWGNLRQLAGEQAVKRAQRLGKAIGLEGTQEVKQVLQETATSY